eukprot:TRINITY_DN11228_c0_g1_i1.p1 TRINITY_DN11228_c0_g1~~TRINITY_DN11228_c0_g1_i1.p1  ORF type:complete len:490 (+),score=56.99 TRINITY_DN11228_c0_g1_i1:108-1577(+)
MSSSTRFFPYNLKQRFSHIHLQWLCSQSFFEQWDQVYISGGAVGTGPAMTGPSGIAYDSQGSKLYVSDSSLNIFQIDPLNGNRVVISSPSLGDGPDLEGPFLLLSYISSTNSLIVSSTNSTIGGDIYSVDIETGDRAIISQGDGPEVETPWETIYEKNTDSILVCDITGLQIVRLDLQSLYKTVISNNSSPSDSLLLGPVGLSSCGEADFSGVASGCTCKTSALFTEGKCECYHNGAYDLDDGCSCPIGNDDAAYITNGEPGCMCIPLGVSQRSYEAGVGCICLSDAVYDSNNYQCRCSGGSNRGTYVKYKGCSCPAAGGVYTVGVGCSCIAPATYNNVSGCTCPGGGAYSTSDGCNCVAPSVPSADGCSCPADSDAFYTSTGCTCPGTAVYSETEGCHCDGGSGVYVKGTGCTCPPNNGATHVKGFGCQCTSPGKYITGAGCTCDGDPSKYTPQKGCKIDASSHIGESSGACLPISTSIVVSFLNNHF